MSEHNIAGKKVAFLLTDGVEQVELTSPWNAVKEAGGVPTLVAPKAGKLQGLRTAPRRGQKLDVDLTVAEANASDFHALVIPGGVESRPFSGPTKPWSSPGPSSQQGGHAASLLHRLPGAGQFHLLHAVREQEGDFLTGNIVL